jgi:hypothetical protein
MTRATWLFVLSLVWLALMTGAVLYALIEY